MEKNIIKIAAGWGRDNDMTAEDDIFRTFANYQDAASDAHMFRPFRYRMEIIKENLINLILVTAGGDIRNDSEITITNYMRQKLEHAIEFFNLFLGNVYSPEV